MDVQADLGLHCLDMPENTFFQGVAHLQLCFNILSGTAFLLKWTYPNCKILESTSETQG